MLLTVRPEDVTILTGPEDAANVVQAVVRVEVYMGTGRHIVVSLGDSEWHLRAPTDVSYPAGETINLRLPPDKIWLFPDGDVGL